MTEQEWLTSKDPVAMLQYLENPSDNANPYHLYPPSQRKLRLFAEAMEPMLSSGDYNDVTDWAEELQVYLQPLITLAVSDPDEQAALFRDIIGNPFRQVTHPCPDCAGDGKVHWPLPIRGKTVERKCPCCDGTGRLPGVNPSWLTPIVLALARVAYDERDPARGLLDPQRLLVLADALEEAGCTDQAILDHLRGPGPHVRGCWVLDMLLGKQ
jgi:hypothetical protein